MTPTDLEKNEELYRIFGAQIGKESSFMRQWVRLYVITNKDHIKNVAAEYLETKGLDISTWIKGVKEGHKGDVLALFVLSVITGVHCFVHLKWHNYWTSVKEIPNTHLEYIQRCNIYLSYLGQGIFAEHRLRTTLVSYKLFGIDQPIELEEKDPVVIGTLTCEENETLDMLLEQSHSQPQVEMGKTTLTNMQCQYGDIRKVVDVKITGINVQAPIIDDTTQMDLDHEDSDSTIILDYQLEYYINTPDTDSNNITTGILEESSGTQVRLVSAKENTMVGLEQLKITSPALCSDGSVMEDERTVNETYDACEEPKQNNIVTQEKNLEDKCKIKKAKVVLQKLSIQEINDASKHKNTKPRLKKSQKTPTQCE